MLGLDPKAARATWTVIAIALLCVTVYTIRQTLFVFVVSLFFAYLLLPIVDFIDRVLPMQQSRAPALAIVYLILVAVIVIAGIEVGSRVADQANLLAQRITDFLKPEPIQSLPLPQPMRSIGDTLLSAARQAIQENYQEILQTLPQAFLRAANAATNLILLIIVPILSFFFLKDGRAMQRYIVAQVDDDVARGALRAFAVDLNVLLAQYIRALVLLGLSAAFAYGTFFTMMGVPYAMLLAALAFPLEFIPMLGPIVSAAIVLLVAALSGYHHLLVIVVFLAVFRIFQDYALSPHLMSAGMELHPLLVVFGVFAGEQIAGIPGAFLSVPVMAILRLLYRRLERRRLRAPSEEAVQALK
jgi:predicted PurR-regulated permease PerM